jgi:hypothetical protein
MKTRHQPHQCQFIEGTPTHRDDCKCLKPTQPGWPYCPEHVERVSPGAGGRRIVPTDGGKIALATEV